MGGSPIVERVMRPCARLVPFIVAILLALSSCGGRTTQQGHVGTDRYERSATLFLNPDEALLNEGQEAEFQGRFDAAEKKFLAVYRNPSAGTDRRARALVELGELLSNILNPRRDRAAAIDYLERVRDEFPEADAKILERAEKAAAPLREAR
jgi:hypothetical protein